MDITKELHDLHYRIRRVTPAVEEQIVSQYKMGIPVVDIAIVLRLSRTTIYRVLGRVIRGERKEWKKEKIPSPQDSQ